MPTVEVDSQTHNRLPDIFRTINGTNLDIGPLDRLRDSDTPTDAVDWGRGEKGGTGRSQFPRIILRDTLGRELDTFTTLQEAIYRAKWNVKQTGQAKQPIEWRLPKAPPPARPDLTRIFPSVKHPPTEPSDAIMKARYDSSRVLKFDVDDVGFVQESLQYLPYAPSLSFLRQEILVGAKTYFQIVGTMLLHKKILSHTEKRHAVYNFPGFCSGCMRTGLCYGCERSSKIHVHADKPTRTGGGFTFFKKDRPENEILSKNPMYWKIQQPDQALKKLMEEYAGVALEGAIPDEVTRHLDKHFGHREKVVSNIPDFPREMQEMKNKENDGRANTLPSIHIQYNSKDENEGDLDEQGEGQDDTSKQDCDLDTSDVKVHREGQVDMTNEDDAGGDQGQPDDTVGSETEQPGVTEESEEMEHSNQLVVPMSGATSWSKTSPGQIDVTLVSGYISSDDEGWRDGSDDRHGQRMSRRVQSDDDRDECEQTNTKQRSPRRGRRRDKLYKAPVQFRLKKNPKRRVVSRSPFSTDRVYDLPRGKGLEVKKSDKRPTQFKEFGNHGTEWKEPKKFELKKNENKPTKFWSAPPKKTETVQKPRRFRRVPPPRPVSPDSGLDTKFQTDTTIQSGLEPLREDTLTITPDMDLLPASAERVITPLLIREQSATAGLTEGMGTPLQHRVQSPEKPPRSVTPPKRREIVKRERKPVPMQTKPPTPVREKTPSPISVEEERPVSREISFDFVNDRSPPELPAIEVPDLPDIQERESEYKGVKKERKLIEVTPEIPEAKKKLPPPPKLGPRIKMRTSRKSRVAEAPVTTQELQLLSDPLDFLAKYCIINPDRLPYYERIFNGAVNVQTPRYSHNNFAAPGEMVKLPPAQLSDHELNMLRDLTVITHTQSPRRDGMNMPDQYLEKLNYSIEFIKLKQEALQDHMHLVQGEKIHLMAEMAKQLDRDIIRVDYKTKNKKKKDEDENGLQKKKKKKSAEPDWDKLGAMSVPKNFRPQRASDITDEVIVSRMDDKMMKKVKKDPEVKKYNVEINRDIEKLKNYDQRISQIEDEKDLIGLYCMDYYFTEQNEKAPYEFRRQQSRLYQKLHPDPDIEMNMDEVEAALQQINNKLLTEREFQYIYFVLDLPKREKINFRLFSIVAALSEKVTQMDPVIRKLINKVDYNALDVKMEKSKELFELLQDESLMPIGNAPADILAVELAAGGLTPEHTSYVLSKFNREGRGFVDFLDFVTYVPLFIEIHRRIIDDPFNELLDV